MKSILMVCLGNICRSPLAEGLLQSKVGNSIQVDSAGTSGQHAGELPDERSIEVAKKHGVDITYQRSRKFKPEDFDLFDKIYVMDASNYNNVKKVARNKEDMKKVDLIMNEINPDQNQTVPDPYFGDSEDFENVYQMLDKATDKIIEKYNL
ncbi:low molecular weight phosphotyrosine protein phosphatase [Flavobacteriaceae bacterium Ap0902]|nr:low molecular weight phosphotyrosine protein phosphatase [Flavobacteriaceae bacterium Ap0902]